MRTARASHHGAMLRAIGSMIKILAPRPAASMSRASSNSRVAAGSSLSDVCRDDGGARCGRWQPHQVSCACAPRDPQLAIRPPRLFNRPRVAVDARDVGPAVGRQRPGGARNPGPTAHVEDGSRWVGFRAERPDDEIGREQMQRRVEQCKRRTFTGGVERAADGRTPPLHVGRREGTQRARDFLYPQIGKMSRLEGGKPFVKDLGVF